MFPYFLEVEVGMGVRTQLLSVRAVLDEVVDRGDQQRENSGDAEDNGEDVKTLASSASVRPVLAGAEDLLSVGLVALAAVLTDPEDVLADP